jgi:translocation and assembly module TamB
MENKAVQGSLQIKGMDLAQWPLPTQWALNGRTDMKAQLSGTRAAPDLQFNVQVRDLTSQAGQTQDLPPIHIQGAGRLGSEQMQAQSSVQAGPGLDLQARLQLPLDFSLHPFQFQIGNTVSGQTQGRADLGQIFASLPVDGQDVSGHLSWDMSCSGPLPLPQLHGRAQLTKGEFELFQTGTLLRKIEGVIELHGDRAEIVRFQATDGEQGSVQASGDIAFGLDQEPIYTLQASLDQATLIRMEVATGAISGDIKLKGNGNEATVQGNLKAFPISVGIPDPSPSGLEGLHIISVQDTPATPDAKDSQKSSPSLIQNTTLDIHVQIPGGLFVRGRGLDSEWMGDLHIQGTAKRPLIAGHVAIKRGHLNLLTKRFTLDQGRITFLSKHPPEPELDLTASTSVKDLLAKVHITGKATEPSLELSSDPALPRDEILARILFNRQLSQITPLQAVKLALAVRTLTSGGKGGVMGSLRQHMGLDELSIDTDPQSSAGPGVTVGAGKYLNEDVYFKVEKGLEENDGRVVVNIRLTPRISIETQAGSEHQGMFISWSYSY